MLLAFSHTIHFTDNSLNDKRRLNIKRKLSDIGSGLMLKKQPL